MPLRLRRGTDSTRTSITPVQGEPIYTTDTKKLFIGDGTTAGGVEVGGTSVSNASDNRIITSDGTSTGLSAETNLSFDGSRLTVTGSVIANSLTGSLQGTATTASYVLNAVSSSFATTSNTASTASYVLNAVSSSFATTASYWGGTVTSASYATTASYVLNAVSSSYATTASYVLNAVSSSFATTASYVLNAVSSSFATNSNTASTASYVLNAVSSSFASNSNTASTASYVLNAVSSSFATTASYLLGGGVSISGPTTDIVNYSGITHYMLVYDGTTNDITGSHLLTINPGNETLDVQVGIEMQGGAPISTTGIISANSGFNVGLNTWTGNNIYATASYAATASRVSTLNQNVTVSGSVFLSGSLHTPVFVDYEEKYTTINHSSAGSITYDLSLGNIFYVNQTANITLSTITNPPTATNLGSFTVILDSDATYTVAWDASVKWPSGNAPDLDNGPAVNIVSFITPNGGTDWYGFVGGLAY